jgi:hypothetical protein
MTTEDFTIELFCRVDDAMPDIPKHPQAHLYPSELVTLGLLYALKARGPRAFYRWLGRNLKPLFPKLPERTRLFRLMATHQDWTRRFLAGPTVLGVADSYGIELVHPMRQGRSATQIGKKGLSNHRWIVGVKLCFVLNQWGLVTDWDCDTANVHDSTFQPLIKQFEEQMIVLTDSNFHAAEGDPTNLKICARGTWNERMLVETVLSMVHGACCLKKMVHRLWTHLKAHLAFVLAAFNLCVQWDGLQVQADGAIPLSFAEFSL